MDFIKGMDISTLIELEKFGAKYYDKGEELDLLEILKRYDVDTIRIRLWNDPYSSKGEPYGAGTNDLETSLAIAKRATKAGMGVLLNLHYSDFRADAIRQLKPKAWEEFSTEELEAAVYEYTAEMTNTFLENGVNLTMIQVGNELTNGLLWPEGKISNYDNMAKFVDAGICGVRAVKKEIPIMLHLDDGGNNELYRAWFDNFRARGEDFDIIGLSYDPFRHGTLDMLEYNMNDLAKRYGKDLIVAEVSMGYTLEDYQSYENLSDEQRKGYATKPPFVEKLEYPMTKKGQADFMIDFLKRIHHVADGKGKGFFYREPAWIPVAGSGWATEASLKYMNDPGPCGNEWANQALFDYEGHILPALGVIRNFPRKTSKR